MSVRVRGSFGPLSVSDNIGRGFWLVVALLVVIGVCFAYPWVGLALAVLLVLGVLLFVRAVRKGAARQVAEMDARIEAARQSARGR